MDRDLLDFEAEIGQFDNLVDPRIRTSLGEQKSLKSLLHDLLAQKADLRKIFLAET